MATPQLSHALDGRAGNEPVWLSDNDLIDDDPPVPRRTFDVVPGALANALEDFYGAQHATFTATIPPPPRQSAAVGTMAIAAAIVMTFGGGWWLGRVNPPPEQTPSVTRVSAHSIRAAVAPAALGVAAARRAPAVLILRPGPAPALAASENRPEKPKPGVYVPTEL